MVDLFLSENEFTTIPKAVMGECRATEHPSVCKTHNARFGVLVIQLCNAAAIVTPELEARVGSCSASSGET
jgi:hypothetical protein